VQQRETLEQHANSRNQGLKKLIFSEKSILHRNNQLIILFHLSNQLIAINCSVNLIFHIKK